VATAEESPCPVCGATDTLQIESRLVASPIGSFALAGAMPKVSARNRPVLTCSACGLNVTGEFTADGRHATFPPLPHT
jgi:hypothetical protein